MSIIDKLAGYAGDWQGINILQDPFTSQPDQSPSKLTVNPVLKNKFVRLDYDWAYQNTEQQGSLLIGYESNAATAHWIDTWHLSDKAMSFRGVVEGDDSILVKGSYAAPPGPDWGWKIALYLKDEQSLSIVMHNISPEGEEDLAVQADYARS